MLTRIRATEEDEGFTLIELLVVIIIIGILAAIAIPTFLNQRAKGWDAASRAEVKSLATALESLNTEQGNYGTDVADESGLALLAAEGYNVSQPFTGAGTLTVDVGADGQSYCIEVSHASQAATFWALSSAEGAPVEGVCTAALVVDPA